MDKSIEIHTDQLFVGLTRAPTILGVPYLAFVLEVIAAALINIGSGNPLYMLFVTPVHGIFYLIAAKDPGLFAEMEIWVKTSGRCMNRGFWDGASFSPLVTRKWMRD